MGFLPVQPYTYQQPQQVNDPVTKDHLMTNTFNFTYVFLLTTGTITLIEALRTKNPVIRHIMNLETCVSIVAAVFYYTFITQLKEAKDKQEPVPFKDITMTRYTDWTITTPLMLLSLCIVLSSENKISFYFSSFLVVLILNFGMLASGYMGETKMIDKQFGLMIGFIFFFALFAYIWYMYMSTGKTTFGASMTFFIYLIIWSMYGLIYFAEERTKNILYNILDLIAKALVGIFLWLYYTGVVKF